MLLCTVSTHLVYNYWHCYCRGLVIINQGKVSGILYLENNLVTGAFTTDRVELPNLLLSQMAMALDNAQLYAKLEEKVAERTKDLKQSQSQLIQSAKMASLGQLTAGIAHEINNPVSFTQVSSFALLVYRREKEDPFIFNQKNQK